MAKPGELRPRATPKRIALAFPIGEAHSQSITRGISDYAREHGAWVLTTGGEIATLPIKNLLGWKGDGIIANLTNAEEEAAARQFQKQGIPVVTFAGTLPRVSVPRARVDSPAIGKLAAEHLMTCGFRRFGLYGLQNVGYSAERARTFCDQVARAGFKCTVHLSPNVFDRHRPWEDEVMSLGEWLGTLEPPVGIFAVNDYRARMVIDACLLRGLKIPREVGILGVDNNYIICEFSEPPMSSIQCDWHSVGFELARLLDRLMEGRPAPTRDLLIPPVGIVKRASTDVVVVSDPRVGRAIDYILEHAHEVFGVEKLVEAAGTSRRSLEEAFAAEMGCSPYRYLCRKRVERAKELMQASRGMKMSDVAYRCGFLDVRRLRLVFQRVEGVSPAQYRRSRGSAQK